MRRYVVHYTSIFLEKCKFHHNNTNECNNNNQVGKEKIKKKTSVALYFV